MNKTVKIYSTATCPYCLMAKKFLDGKGIVYENYDVGKDQEKSKEMVDKSGQMGVPVLDIEGKIIVGFDKNEISKELGI
ncbi:MAG: glutaredoxin domain-containing protein [Planctomycetota bacterium]